MKLYVTFGQVHVHSVNGKTFDKDCIAVIDCKDEADGRDKAFDFFDGKFCFAYPEDRWKQDNLEYYPRGLMAV